MSMLSGEDFGYVRGGEASKPALIAKKVLLFSAVLFSIICFIYITINAYYFSYNDKNTGIRLIKAPIGPIKVKRKKESGTFVRNIDKTVYDNIVSSKDFTKENLGKVKIIKTPNTPLPKDSKEIKRRTISSGNIVVYEDYEKNNIEVVDLLNLEKAKKFQVKQNLKGLARIQVAALSSKESAQKYWSKLKKEYSSLFANLNHFIIEADLGKRGVFYRLQIGNFRGQVEAEKFCQEFISQSSKSKIDCIIVE